MNIADNEDSSGYDSEYNGDKGFQGLQIKNGGTCKTLDEHQLYLDSCATYNSCFIEKFLDSITDSDMVLHGNFNTGTTITNQVGWYGACKMVEK